MSKKYAEWNKNKLWKKLKFCFWNYMNAICGNNTKVRKWTVPLICKYKQEVRKLTTKIYIGARVLVQWVVHWSWKQQ